VVTRSPVCLVEGCCFFARSIGCKRGRVYVQFSW
jgi:hypothetical protein